MKLDHVEPGLLHPPGRRCVSLDQFPDFGSGQLSRHHAGNFHRRGADRPAEQGEPARVVDLTACEGAALVDGLGNLCEVLDVLIVMGPNRSEGPHVGSGHGNALDNDHGQAARPHHPVVLDQVRGESTLHGGIAGVQGRHDEAVGEFLVADRMGEKSLG